MEPVTTRLDALSHRRIQPVTITCINVFSISHVYRALLLSSYDDLIDAP